MERALALMKLCRIGTIVSAIIFVLAAALAVYLFIKYDVRTLLAIQNGKAEQISVKKMKEKAIETGQLEMKIDLDYETDNLKKKNRRNTGKTAKTAAADAVAGTVALDTQPVSYGAAYGIRFDLLEEIVVTHTSETI